MIWFYMYKGTPLSQPLSKRLASIILYRGYLYIIYSVLEFSELAKILNLGKFLGLASF